MRKRKRRRRRRRAARGRKGGMEGTANVVRSWQFQDAPISSCLGPKSSTTFVGVRACIRTCGGGWGGLSGGGGCRFGCVGVWVCVREINQIEDVQ